MRKDISEFSGIQSLSADFFQDNRGTLLKLNLEKDLQVDSVLVSDNLKAGTFRGLHVQTHPYGEFKLVKCISGRIVDFILDVRPNSATLGDWCQIILESETPNYLFIPPGFAHGFQSLVDDSSVLYCISGDFNPEHNVVLAISDPDLNISLPLPISEISKRDLEGMSLKDFLALWGK
jgi:dTDP-4-dehydrorhamnose 3,5-epimerase